MYPFPHPPICVCIHIYVHVWVYIQHILMSHSVEQTGLEFTAVCHSALASRALTRIEGVTTTPAYSLKPFQGQNSVCTPRKCTKTSQWNLSGTEHLTLTGFSYRLLTSSQFSKDKDSSPFMHLCSFFINTKSSRRLASSSTCFERTGLWEVS